MCSDDNKLQNFGTRKLSKDWRSKVSENENSNKYIVVPRVMHYSVLVMVCECMASSCAENLVLIESTMQKQIYLTILKTQQFDVTAILLPYSYLYRL